ncbi:MAG: UbiX family flavin prenyltransferase [Thermodesulfobacteriota bacterium]
MKDERQRALVAITGASGSLYALHVLAQLARLGVEVHGIVSEAGRQVLALETDREPASLAEVAVWHRVTDLAAAPASGSSRYAAMIVVPCSMGTLAAIAGGLSRNLIHRAADVTLKERRPLVLAVRESPVGRIHLANMLAAHDAGAIICPAMPAFYHRPASLDEMAGYFAGRLCELAGFPIPDLARWRGVDNGE